jgi:nudix-type nucleoside diphosphatase (YffH/AdpP family)
MPDPRRVNVISRRELLDDFLNVQEAVVEFEKFDGQMSPPVRRLKLDRGDSAAVLLYNPDEDVVALVEQFKWPTFDHGDGWILETVAGVVDHGETPEQAAIRETFEETGFAVSNIEPVAMFYASPGGSSERIYLYCAYIGANSQLGEGGGMSIENEDIRVRIFPRSLAFNMIAEGKIIDAKTILALWWLRDKLGRQN